MHDMLDYAKKKSFKRKRKSKKNLNAFKMIASMFSRRYRSYRT